MIFPKCFQNCNPFLNLEILPLKRKVAEAPCVALDVVAAEQVFEAIAIPVVPVAPAPQRGWTRWCVRAALAVGNMIPNNFIHENI
jgi:hypothetical protein